MFVVVRARGVAFLPLTYNSGPVFVVHFGSSAQLAVQLEVVVFVQLNSRNCAGKVRYGKEESARANKVALEDAGMKVCRLAGG